jgi:hypothetical protein
MFGGRGAVDFLTRHLLGLCQSNSFKSPRLVGIALDRDLPFSCLNGMALRKISLRIMTWVVKLQDDEDVDDRANLRAG